MNFYDIKSSIAYFERRTYLQEIIRTRIAFLKILVFICSRHRSTVFISENKKVNRRLIIFTGHNILAISELLIDEEKISYTSHTAEEIKFSHTSIVLNTKQGLGFLCAILPINQMETANRCGQISNALLICL